jgi:AcrR family transcriptional regulator
MIARMGATADSKRERRAKTHQATRASILDAARRTIARDGVRALSLRAVAAEAGFAPASLYSYLRNRDELLLALAADDLSGLARAVRLAAGNKESPLAAALAQLQNADSLASVASALPRVPGTSEAERLFNGRLIAVLTALSETGGRRADSRAAQRDVVLLAAALTGLAVLGRSGRLDALGFAAEELIGRLEARFLDGV